MALQNIKASPQSGQLKHYSLNQYSWAVANGLAGWSGIWKEQYWKVGDKEVWGRGKCIDVSEWAEDMKMCVLCECSLKGRLSRGNNNQMDETTHFVDTYHLISSISPIMPIELMNKVGMVAGMKVMHGLIHMDFHSSVLPWLGPLLCTQSTSRGDQHWEHDMTLGWSASFLVINWLYWAVSIMEEPALCSYRNGHLVWI